MASVDEQPIAPSDFDPLAERTPEEIDAAMAAEYGSAMPEDLEGHQPKPHPEGAETLFNHLNPHGNVGGTRRRTFDVLHEGTNGEDAGWHDAA